MKSKAVKEDISSAPIPKELSSNDKESISPYYKNKIYKYKDGSTTRVTYDSKDTSYVTIDVN